MGWLVTAFVVNLMSMEAALAVLRRRRHEVAAATTVVVVVGCS